MIGAGMSADKVTIFPTLQKMIDYKTSYGCEGEEECKIAAQESAEASVKANALDTPEKQDILARLGVYVTMQVSQAECRILTKGTKATWQACYGMSAKGALPEAGGSDIPWLKDDGTYEFISHPEFEMRIGKLIADKMVAKAQVVVRSAKTMPSEFKDFLESLKDNPELARVLMLLYNQALDQVGANRMNEATLAKAADGIGKSLIAWAKGDPANGVPAPSGDEVAGAYVDKISDDGGYDIKVDSAPAKLFDPAALGLKKGDKLPDDAISELMRIFYNSLMNARAKNLGNSGPEAVADKVIAGVAKKVADKKVGSAAKLAPVLATIRSVVPKSKDKDGKKELDSVRMDDNLSNLPSDAAKNIPGRLLLGMGLDPNKPCDVLRALRELWDDEIEQNEEYKKIPDDKKAAATEKIVDALLKQLPKASVDAVDRADEISKLYVKSIGKDGSIAFASPPLQLFKRFENAGAAGIAMNRVLTSKFFKPAEQENAKLDSPRDRAMLASDVAERADQADKFKNSDKLPINIREYDGDGLELSRSNEGRAALLGYVKYDGLGEDGVPKPFKLEEAKEGKEGKSYLNGLVIESNSSGGVYDRDGKAVGGTSTDLKISYEHELGKSLSLGGEIGVNAGYNPSIFGKPEDQLMYAKQGDSEGYKLKSASLFLQYKFNEQTSGKASAGIIGGTGDLNSIFGGGVKVTHKTKDEAFSVTASAAAGKVLNISSMAVAASEKKQIELGDWAANLALGASYLLHKKSETTLSASMMYQPVFAEKTQHAFAVEAALETTPKYGNDNLFPISLSNTLTAFDVGGKTTYSNALSASVGYLRRYDDLFSHGPVLGVEHTWGSPEKFQFGGTTPGEQIFENSLFKFSAGYMFKLNTKNGVDVGITPKFIYHHDIGNDVGGAGGTIDLNIAHKLY